MEIPGKSITIIIPALNEERAIGNVVKDMKREFADAEILVINDGSVDRTEEIGLQAGARVINHEMRMGYGAALITGIRSASGEYVLFCDGDGQHSAVDARAVVAQAGDFDMVVGARTAGSNAPAMRKPGKLVIRIFADFLAGRRIPDLNSGLRLFKRDSIMRYLHLMPSGFSFSTTSTFAMLKSKRKIKYVPITVRERIGESTVRQWRHGPMTLMLLLRLTVLFEPLKIFLSVAAFLFVLGVASLVNDIARGSGGIGDTTVLMAVSSLIIFMFGLLCDQVSAIRREKHD